MDRETCIAFIEHTYFGNVQDGNIDGVMKCFAQQVEVIIRHGDRPARLFKVLPSGGETPLRDFYRHLCGNYDAWFGDFRHVVDSAANRAACHFKVCLSPKPDGQYADTGPQELLNCNFFEFDNGVISHMIIYYANPQSGGFVGRGTETPTGYPR